MIHPMSISTTIPNAIGPDGKYYPTPLPNSIGSDGKYYHTPSDDDPQEAPEDTQHGVSIYEKINRRKNPLKQGLLPPNPRKDARFLDPAVELTPEEVMDLDEISELEGLRVVSEEEPTEDNPSGYCDIKWSEMNLNVMKSPSFDIDFDGYGKS